MGNTDGYYSSMRVAPYRTTENVIDGVVITFVDLTEVKEAAVRERTLATVVTDSNDAITVQDFEGNIVSWKKGAKAMYGYSETGALNMNIFEIIPKGKRK